MFYIAILPSFVDALRPLVPQTLLLSVVFVVITTGVHATIVTLAGAALPLLENRRQSTTIRRVLSLALIGVAAWLAWSTRL